MKQSLDESALFRLTHGLEGAKRPQGVGNNRSGQGVYPRVIEFGRYPESHCQKVIFLRTKMHCERGSTSKITTTCLGSHGGLNFWFFS